MLSILRFSFGRRRRPRLSKAQELSPEGGCVKLTSVPWRTLRYGLPERNNLGKLGLVRETVGARDAVVVEDDWSRMTDRG
jgi:hypothetical protein